MFLIHHVLVECLLDLSAYQIGAPSKDAPAKILCRELGAEYRVSSMFLVLSDLRLVLIMSL